MFEKAQRWGPGGLRSQNRKAGKEKTLSHRTLRSPPMQRHKKRKGSFSKLCKYICVCVSISIQMYISISSIPNL